MPVDRLRVQPCDIVPEVDGVFVEVSCQDSNGVVDSSKAHRKTGHTISEATPCEEDAGSLVWLFRRFVRKYNIPNFLIVDGVR